LVAKTHIARLKFPAPATDETWVADQDGEPVFMVVAEPSESLAGELRRLLPQLGKVMGEGRRVTVCFDRGGWPPALFADIIEAGFDLLTWRMGPAPDLPADAFTTITCADDRSRVQECDLADTTVTLDINDGPRKGGQVTLRQVTHRVPALSGATWQIHALTTCKDVIGPCPADRAARVCRAVDWLRLAGHRPGVAGGIRTPRVRTGGWVGWRAHVTGTTVLGWVRGGRRAGRA
jgi:hypothetical protein